MQSDITTTLRETLQQVFSYEQFRADQEAIIKNVLAGKHTFVIMPTGGGKSLCYQIPALMREGVAIVVSPLIALMKNQVDQLRKVGVHAAFVNSTLSKKETEAIQEDVLSGVIKLLYIAPESLLKEDTMTFLKQATISFIAIDEVHCISDWGHDFRPEYRKIKPAIDQALGTLPIIGLTATATPKVQKDILKNLSIENATLFKSSFNRPNLYYEVRSSVQVDKELIRFIKGYPNASGIVYCQNRKKVEELAALLNLNGIRAVPYHAGLEYKIRMKNQDAFLNKAVEVTVATIAFGMGIDKPDVRFVVHYNIPRSLEGYYQETGRAGRDGRPSTCLMFYHPEDVHKMQRLNKNKPAAECERAQYLLQTINSYVLSGICRRKYLLYYFGETLQDDCHCCDNCQAPTATYAGEDFVKMLLMAVQQMQERFSVQHTIHLLRGVADPYIKSHHHQTLPTFGKGRAEDDAFWQSVISQTLLLGLLSKDMGQLNILKITQAGRSFLKKSYAITLHRNNSYGVPDSYAHSAAHGKKYDQTLLDLMMALREKIAQTKSIPAYAVFQDNSLRDMALAYPITLEDLSRIHGISMHKAKKFGPPFIQLIQDYVKQNNITIVAEDVVVKSAASRSANKVYIIQQIDRKTSLERIALAKSLSMDALLKEMEQLCYAGTKLNIDYHIVTILSDEQQEVLYDYFMHAKTDSIQAATMALEEKFDEQELRMMRIKFLSEVAN